MQLVNVTKLSLAALALMAASAMAAPASLALTATGGALADDDGTNTGVTTFTFNAPGTSQKVQSVQSITLTGLQHTYVSDLYASLLFVPNDATVTPTEAVLFDGLNDGVNFISNNVNGNYSFTNSASIALQEASQPDNDDAVIASGSYLPSKFYLEGDSADVVDLTAKFAGIDVSTGHFQLYFEDFAEGDSGTLTGATINLTSVVPEPTSIATLGLLGGAALRRRRA